MSKQVITITPSGTMNGLQRKPNQGLDLRQFGKAEIKRATEIAWCTITQKWVIEVKVGLLAGYRVSERSVNAIAHGLTDKENTGSYSPATFSDYDEAVKVEIAYLDGLRLRDPLLIDS